MQTKPPSYNICNPFDLTIVAQIGKVSGEMDPPKFDVTGLEEGEEYLFRVTAINDEGESEPLVADAAIKAKNPFGNYPFYLTNHHRDRRIHIGRIDLLHAVRCG